jgi:hypothetical protein
MVDHARRVFDGLGPGEVEIEMRNGVVLIDLREDDELRSHGRIADSVWAPRGMLEFWADPACPDHRAEFDPDTRILLYCASGTRSAPAGRRAPRGWVEGMEGKRTFGGCCRMTN